MDVENGRWIIADWWIIAMNVGVDPSSGKAGFVGVAGSMGRPILSY